jgi:cytochrome b
MMDSTEMTRTKEAGSTLRVWDVPVRLFHWALVALIFTSWLTSEIGGNAMTYHMWSGYTILTLVTFRILWGCAGSQNARFRDFVYGPGAVLRYARDLRRPDAKFYAGHNPMGGWSVVCLLSSVLLQATTGLFANDDIATEGPLAGMVSEETSALLTTIHGYNFYVLLTLICLHVAAVLFYLLVKKENLIGAMFTGRKRVPAHAELTEGRMASNWLALLIFAVVAGAVVIVVNWQ